MSLVVVLPLRQQKATIQLSFAYFGLARDATRARSQRRTRRAF